MHLKLPGGKRVKAIYKGEVVASSGNYCNLREVTAEITLNPTDDGQPYTVYVSTFKAGKTCDFVLAAYCKDASPDPAWVDDGNRLRRIGDIMWRLTKSSTRLPVASGVRVVHKHRIE